MDLRDDIDRFLAQGAAEGRRPATIASYRDRLLGALRFLRERGVTRWPDVAPSDLQAFCLHLADLGRTRSTRISFANTLQLFFRTMVASGRVLRNPAVDLPIPPDDLEDLVEPPLSEAQVAALFEVHPRESPINLRDILHLELLYGAGLRVGESVALDLGDIDVANRVLQVRDGKGGKDRVVPLFSGVLAALDAYLAVRASLLRGPDHGALLISSKGKRCIAANIQAHLIRLSREPWSPTKRLHPHLFRHSIAVHLLRGGADVKHVQSFLGHSDIETTRRYLKVVPGFLAEVYHKHMPEIAVKVAGMGASAGATLDPSTSVNTVLPLE